MQTENDTSKPETEPKQKTGEGCPGAPCSARCAKCGMKPEQQRTAIAEACGWKSKFVAVPDGDEGDVWINPNGFSGELPNYLNDLNAMHAAWLTLPPSKKDEFESMLYEVVIGDADYNRNDDAGWITNATAAQRAEAFLKTINKWEP